MPERSLLRRDLLAGFAALIAGFMSAVFGSGGDVETPREPLAVPGGGGGAGGNNALSLPIAFADPGTSIVDTDVSSLLNTEPGIVFTDPEGTVIRRDGDHALLEWRYVSIAPKGKGLADINTGAFDTYPKILFTDKEGLVIVRDGSHDRVETSDLVIATSGTTLDDMRDGTGSLDHLVDTPPAAIVTDSEGLVILR